MFALGACGEDEQSREAAEIRSACASEPVDAGFRHLPRGLTYGEPPAGLRAQFAREFPASYRDFVKFRLVLAGGERVGAVLLLPSKDAAKTIADIVAGVEESAGRTLDTRDVSVDGRSWTSAEVNGGTLLVAGVGCRVVAVLTLDLAPARRLASILGRGG